MKREHFDRLSAGSEEGVENVKFKIMTKEELFKKYSINESHNAWDNSIDNWNGVEIYRLMHNGNLPLENDKGVLWVIDFLEKKQDMSWWVKNVMSRDDFGNLYLTAKRFIYSMSDQILNELTDKEIKSKS